MNSCKYSIDLELLLKTESQWVEWKEKGADSDNITKTLSAFANDYPNMGGGYLLCGIKEAEDEFGNKTAVKIGLSASELKQIKGKVLSLCREKVSPAISPATEEIKLPNQKYIVIFIVPADNEVHTFRGRDKKTAVYIRTGSHTIEARNSFYLNLMLKKGKKKPWDTDITDNASIKDIDKIIFTQYIENMNIKNVQNPMELLTSEQRFLPLADSFVEHRKLTGNITPKNFAILLFCKNPTKFFPGAYSVFSVYPGTDKNKNRSKRLEITGTIIQQIEQLLQCIEIENKTIFLQDLKNPGNKKFPQQAVREALVNAVVHRDYTGREPVRVTMFDDRIEIISQGALVPGIKKKDFENLMPIVPVWRNQSLAFYCGRLQLAEAEGQGLRIIAQSAKQGFPKPIFKAQPNNVICIFPANTKLMQPQQEVLNSRSADNYFSAIEFFTAKDYEKALFYAGEAVIGFASEGNSKYALRCMKFLIESCLNKITYREIEDKETGGKVEELYTALTSSYYYYEVSKDLRDWMRKQ